MQKLIIDYLKQESENKKKDEQELSSSVEISNSHKASPIFKSRIESVNSGICFVLMPYSQNWSDNVYNKLIKKTIEELGLQCIRADNLNGPIVIEDIWTQINHAGLIIADVTGKNPNVMYELGIAHTIGKPVVLITQEPDDIPFDFLHLRHHAYEATGDGYQMQKSSLEDIIKDTHKSNYPKYKNQF